MNIEPHNSCNYAVHWIERCSHGENEQLHYFDPPNDAKRSGSRKCSSMNSSLRSF